MESVSEIERLQLMFDELKQKYHEEVKHNQMLLDEVSKLTNMLNNVEFSTNDDEDIEELEPVDEEADSEENSKWLPLKGFDDYVIINYYPYDIKRVSTDHIIKECIIDGYVSVSLILRCKHKKCLKHILVARQFIPNDNPKNKRYVDHKNRKRDDYHISNLRWVTES